MIDPIRVTDSAGLGIASSTVEYGTRRLGNCTGTKLLILEPGHFSLYDGVTLKRIEVLDTIGDANEPLWHRTNPDIVYFHFEDTLMECNFATGLHTPIHTFTEYASISGMGESDLSEDGDHIVLCGDGKEIFVYEISTGTKGPVTQAPKSFDSLYLTSRNEILVSVGRSADPQEAIDNPTGMWLYPSLRQIANADGHKMVGVFNGEPVLIWTNSDEKPVTLLTYPNAIVMIRLSDGRQTGLLSLDWSLCVDICVPTGANYAIVSTYSADPKSTVAYANAILKVPFDGSSVTELCKHGSDASKGYDGQPRAYSDGKRVWFNSNKGGITDVYVCDLPVTPPDTSQLQRMLDAGGVITLAPGVYNCPAGLEVRRNGVRLLGAGYSQVTIKTPFLAIRPGNHTSQVEDVEVSGVTIYGGQLLIDLMTFSKVDIHVANSPDWALKITCTGSVNDLDTDINEIHVAMHDCAKGWWIGKESAMGVNCCHNRLFLTSWNIASPIHGHIADTDNNEFHRILAFDDGSIELETDKAYSNSFFHLQAAMRLLNTGKPPYQKNLIWHFDKANGQTDPVCDTVGAVPDSFLVWVDSSGNQHGLNIPEYYVPQSLTAKGAPQLGDKQPFLVWAPPDGFQFCYFEGKDANGSRHLWATKMEQK